MTHPCEETLPGGGHTSLVIKKGQLLRLTDTDGGANVSLMLFNAHEKSERLNLPDTLKGQHTARLTAGHCLYSDMGRVLAAIVTDTCGWHDSFGGVLNASETAEKYGQGRYQERRNDFHRNGLDNLLVEMGKWNLGLEDLHMVLNLFSKVTVDAQGAFTFHDGHSAPGSTVELYAPMDVLVVLTALPHPMDPNPAYRPCPVQISLHDASDAVTAGCKTSRPENQRAFDNITRFAL
ncbi:urea amidolyase associated protein UAAP1 [Erwinia persicina]|uniref:Urea carboxylase-associated family protein n=1 Tax=Erwinia persicina TaxID=55211 RepID=A0ABR8ZNB4_9GAMM|nr:urea amidolyase associated protein UAAP1 [Erwinia persicina]MBD8105113.1 urea carboxylase-associated family protein [Erwinia persicina]MBD8208259.1 urea carboxylase-associated family protein [Erwinia persicina]HBT52969.1 urea carboxylase [Erwinia persicina]